MICLLLKSGRLVGPFWSKEQAVRWAALQSARAYAVYDLVSPFTVEGELIQTAAEYDAKEPHK